MTQAGNDPSLARGTAPSEASTRGRASTRGALLALREHPYAPFLQRVTKPSRYVGGEHGEVVKDSATRRLQPVPRVPRRLRHRDEPPRLQDPLLASSTTHPQLARRARYAPWIDMEARAARARRAAASRSRPRGRCTEFDVVGFSLQFELTYTNVLPMLDLGGIPLRARERGEDDPLVIAGGPTATHPEPLARVHRRVRDRRRRGEDARARARLDRAQAGAACRARERLTQLAKLGGVYVPVAVRRRASTPTPACSYVARANAPEAPLPVQARVLARPQQVPLPRRRPGRQHRDRVRSHVGRDRARLHRGLPLLPGGHDLPPGARARPAGDRRHDRDAPCAKAATTRPRSRCLSTADYARISPLVQQGDASSSQKERVSLSVSSLRAYGLDRGAARRDPQVRATRPHVRARGRHAAHARRGQQERHRGAARWRRPSACSRAAGPR